MVGRSWLRAATRLTNPTSGTDTESELRTELNPLSLTRIYTSTDSMATHLRLSLASLRKGYAGNGKRGWLERATPPGWGNYPNHLVFQVLAVQNRTAGYKSEGPLAGGWRRQDSHRGSAFLACAVEIWNLLNASYTQVCGRLRRRIPAKV